MTTAWTPASFQSAALQLVQVLDHDKLHNHSATASAQNATAATTLLITADAHALPWSYSPENGSLEATTIRQRQVAVDSLRSYTSTGMTGTLTEECKEDESLLERRVPWNPPSNSSRDRNPPMITLEDDSIWDDGDAATMTATTTWTTSAEMVSLAATAGGEASREQFECGPPLTRAEWTEWHLSIVYSDIWRVPVLYFTVQRLHKDASTTVVSRRDVLDMLVPARLQGSSNTTAGATAAANIGGGGGGGDDMWDFVSVEEHPVTGVPSFLLHPCRIGERLQALTTTVTPPCHGHTAATSSWNSHTTAAAVQLWSWWAMVLPTVGLSVEPHTYQRVRTLLQHTEMKV